MRKISEIILEKYQVRKTRKQKDEFIQLLGNELNEHIIIEQCGMFKSRNIIIGDLNKSKYVLTAHYDTAPVLPFPNFLTPKNLFIYLMFNIVLVGIFIMIGYVCRELVYLLTNSEMISSFVYMLIYWFFLGWMFFGKANKHTVNDNTSGIITLLELMECKDIRDQVCFVFFDHEEMGLLGSGAFKKKHKHIMKDKLLINFDCVSDGNYIMMITSESASQYKEELMKCMNYEGKELVITDSKNTIYPSDQKHFINHIGVAAFHKNKICGYYINKIHTHKDLCLDIRNIDMLVQGIERFIKRNG